MLHTGLNEWGRPPLSSFSGENSNNENKDLDLFNELKIVKVYDYNVTSFQHGVFNENEMKFYAAEVILGLDHMHRYSIFKEMDIRQI